MSEEVRPGYKRTEVGVIPEDWAVDDLSQLTDPNRPIGYGIVQTGRRIANGVKCVRVVDIGNGHINDDDMITTSQEISSSYKRTLLAEGDLVIALRGRIGALAIVEKNLVGANLTRGVALLAPLDGHDNRYLCHYLSSPKGKQVLEKNLNGSALQEIPIATLRKIPTIIPPLPEQRAIAEALSDVDALLGAMDRLIAKKRDLKQAAMQQLLTGQTRLPGFHGEWEVKTIDQVGFVTSGKRLPLGCSLVEHSTPHPYVRVTDMRPGTVSLSEIKFVPESVFPAIKRYRIFCEDIFISVAGSLGIVGKVPKELDGANLTENANRITNITCSQDFLMHVLMSPLIQNIIDTIQTVGAQPKLALTRIRKFIISLPPFSEQTAIATILSDMDAELAALKTRRNKTQALKQGMMQELLTGKTRLLAPGAFHA